jgi:histidinol-phosphate phosphatase family protein
VTEQKRTYAERISTLQRAAVPPLTNAELSLGLELDEREVGRFLSARSATARPDGELRALIDQVLAGRLALAVRAGLPGARREVLVAEPGEVRRLDRSWRVLPLGAEVGFRADELEDDAVWSLGAAPAAVRRPVERRRLLGRDVFPIVLGTLRLATPGRPDEAQAIALLHAAADAGIDVFDTADSYGLDEEDLGYGERLLARSGVRGTIVTKAGLRRPGGRWVPDGSPARLRAACEGSLRNLAVEALDLLLLHVVDPRVPLAESVGALARLREQGKVRAVGLSNVSAQQLAEARAIVPIAAVQVELSRSSPANLLLAGACDEAGIALLAHRPLGGHARRGHPPDGAAGEAAARLGVSPAQVSLAWLLSMAPNLLPVVGATRVESVRDSAAAATLGLGETSGLDRGMPARVEGDAIVLITGSPASGKTSQVQAFVDRGFSRLNRDEVGGTLDGLVPLLEAGVAAGRRRWVLDNTYPTRASRRRVLEAARKAGIPARSVHMDTPLAEALYNACLRLIRRHGRLLDPEDIKQVGEVNDVPPHAIFRYFQAMEPASVAEGFARVEVRPFERARTGHARAVLLDLDGTLRRTRSGAPFPRTPDDVELLPGRRERLQALHADGWLLLGVSNQSGVARGELTREAAEACFARTAELLGVPLPVRYCPHASGEIRCWCRKPMPGLGVAWIEERGLDRSACVMVGDMASDAEFARNLGVEFAGEAFWG